MKSVYIFSVFASVLMLTSMSGLAQARETVTLTYWSSSNPEEVQLAAELVKEWNQTHPEIQVKTQPIPAGASSEEVLLAAVVAKTTPDLCSNILPAIMNRLVSAKAVIALDQFPDWKSYMTERMDQSILDMYRSKDGKYYQIPWKSNPVMLAYNADMFRDLGIKPPRTYAEFMEAARKLTRDTNGDGRKDTWAMNPSTLTIWWQRLFDFFPFYIGATSGKTLLKNDKVDFDRPESVKVLKFFAEGFKNGYFPNTGSAGDLFLDQKVGMSVVGPWAIKYYERAMTKKFRFDFAPLPVPDESIRQVYTYGDPKNIAVFSTARHPKEAWEFTKFLISRKADLRLLSLTNQIPIRKNLVKDSYFDVAFTAMPSLRYFADQASRIAPMDDSPHLVQILDFIGQQYEASAVYGVLQPEDAIKSAINTVERIYKYW